MDDSLGCDEVSLDTEKLIHYRYKLRNQLNTIKDIFKLLEDIIDDGETSENEIICIAEELRDELRNLIKMSKQ